MINFHEVGHTFLARVGGDSEAVYVLYRRDPLCIGCNIYDESLLSEWGNLFVAAGGLIFTQAAALLLTLNLPHVARPSWRWAAMAAWLVFLLDVPVQVVQVLMADVDNQTQLTRVDLADFLYILKNNLNLSPLWGKVIIAVVALFYLFLSIRFVQKRWAING